MIRYLICACGGLVLLAATTVAAQQATPLVPTHPTPGCSATSAELEANKRAALRFFETQGDDRVALIDPSYVQHNPAFIKGARDAGMSDYDYFVSRFGGAGAAGRRGGGPRAGGAGGRGAAAGPQPPAGNNAEVVTAECDIVTIVRKQYRQDPTEPPGTFYEAFTFDTFRVRNGRLVEHWDAAVIADPAGN